MFVFIFKFSNPQIFKFIFSPPAFIFKLSNPQIIKFVFSPPISCIYFLFFTFYFLLALGRSGVVPSRRCSAIIFFLRQFTSSPIGKASWRKKKDSRSAPNANTEYNKIEIKSLQCIKFLIFNA